MYFFSTRYWVSMMWSYHNITFFLLLLFCRSFHPALSRRRRRGGTMPLQTRVRLVKRWVFNFNINQIWFWWELGSPFSDLILLLNQSKVHLSCWGWGWGWRVFWRMFTKLLANCTALLAELLFDLDLGNFCKFENKLKTTLWCSG